MKNSRFLFLFLLVGLLTLSSCTSTNKKIKKTSRSINSITSKEVETSQTPSSSLTVASSISTSNTSSSSTSSLTKDSSITPPPEDDYQEIKTFTKRMPAEFEPCEQVIMCYPEMMDASVYKEIAKDNKILLLCHKSNNESSRIIEAQNWVTSNSMKEENFTYLDMNLDALQSYWVRDFSPFFVYNNLDLGIVDFTYNRSQRTNQNKVPQNLATYFNMSYSKMSLTHTGGNLMQNGRGTAFSDDLIINENSNNETLVRSQMETYTGTDNYVITIDPQGDYIAHIDCWAKIVSPDKIIVAKLPISNPRYSYYEQVASQLANTKCSYGYNYKIYRVEEPGGNTVAPYTNSLITNKHVYLPLGSNSTYNQKAMQVYQEALPGYEIHGIANSNHEELQFLNTDALHCRTHEIPSTKNVFIDSREVLHDNVSSSTKKLVKCNIVSYDKQSLKSVKLYYSINDGAYQSVDMNKYKDTSNYTFEFTSLNEGDNVKYYIEAIDNNNNVGNDPIFKEKDPHQFSVI